MSRNPTSNKIRELDDRDAEDAFTSEGGYVAREQGEGRSCDAALMARFSIRHDGRHYRYGKFRYDRLADAVLYARLMRQRHTPEQNIDLQAFDGTPKMPNAVDRQRMAALSISFEAGVYEFNGFHYDHLADAVSYAELTHRRHAAGLWSSA